MRKVEAELRAKCGLVATKKTEAFYSRSGVCLSISTLDTIYEAYFHSAMRMERERQEHSYRDRS